MEIDGGHLRAELRVRFSNVPIRPATVAARIARDISLSLACPTATSAVPGIGWGDPFERPPAPAAKCRSSICCSYPAC